MPEVGCGRGESNMCEIGKVSVGAFVANMNILGRTCHLRCDSRLMVWDEGAGRWAVYEDHPRRQPSLLCYGFDLAEALVILDKGLT